MKLRAAMWASAAASAERYCEVGPLAAPVLGCVVAARRLRRRLWSTKASRHVLRSHAMEPYISVSPSQEVLCALKATGGM